VTVNSLRTRALIGLAALVLMVIFGVLLSAAGGRATHGHAATPATTARPLSVGPTHARAAGALHPRPNPRTSHRLGRS
jgi:hypothetical protein